MKWELGEPQSEGLSVTMNSPAPENSGALNSQETGLREIWFSLLRYEDAWKQ